MNNKDIENWEQELKNKLNSHTEPTDAKDFDAFINKLDENNFFEKKSTKSFGKWAILAGVLLAGMIYWMLSREESGEEKIQIPEVMEFENNQEKFEEIITPVDSVHKIEEAGKPKETVLTTPAVRNQESLENKTIDQAENAEQVEEKDSIKAEAIVENIIDTVSPVTEVKQDPKVQPARRKPVFIMSSDTTVVIDTSRIKHRKKDKRIKKGKK